MNESTTRVLRRAVATLLALLFTLGLVRLSGISYTPPGSGSAVLRLSWRARGELIQACRRPDPAELARLPAHMRQQEICEGRTSPFHLRLEIDGNAAVDDTVMASGARGDRPVYVYRELPLRPGHHAIAVAFVEVNAPVEPDTTRPEAFPRRVEFATDIEAVAGRAVLITWDEDRRSLVARGSGS